MADPVQTWLTTATLKTMAQAVVAGLNLSTSTASSGTYQSPTKSRLLQACDALPKTGLTKSRHLLTLADAFEAARTPDYSTASSGVYEIGDRNLRRAAGKLLKKPNSFVKKATAEKVLALFADRSYP